MTDMDCFKAYDIRGRVPSQINEDMVRRTGYLFGEQFGPGKVVVGRDVRLSSESLAEALMDGLQRAGMEVLDIGQCGTENVYFATMHSNAAGGIMVTASHNPMDYNGLKLVREQARPISLDTGLGAIRDRLMEGDIQLPEPGGSRRKLDAWDDYTDHLLGYIDVDSLRPLRVLANPGNGGAGLAMQRLEPRLPLEFIPMDYEPDGTFPNGIPNPLLPENQHRTAARVRETGADIGVAWDGDYDRCFLFDETGNFVNGYYLVGLIAAEMLAAHPGSAIVHDPRLVWNTIEVVGQAGGRPVMSRTGHSLIKDVMRQHDAVYGGEISGHHYFRDFSFCDSGMIPWLLVVSMMSRRNQPLSALIRDYQSRFPASDEINRKVPDAAALLRKVESHYRSEAVDIDHMDGVSIGFDDWRFNLRMSNTEPLIRLNVETRRDADYLQKRIDEVTALLAD